MSFEKHFRDTYFSKIVCNFSHVNFTFGSFRTVIAAPFTQSLTQIISVPETTIENPAQPFIPIVHFFHGKFIFQCRIHGFAVTGYHCFYIFRSACTPFNLENTNTGFEHFVQKSNGFQVFGRHDVFVVNFQFNFAVFVLYSVAAATNLVAFSAISRQIFLVQTQVAFTRNSHTKRTVAKHFNPDQFTVFTPDILFHNSFMNFSYLFQVQFARQHHHIGKLSIEFQRVHIGNIRLNRKMNLNANA